MTTQLSAAQRARVDALEQRFCHIERTRMTGVPVCHPRLRVAAVGFAPDAAGRGLVGVLLSSWFMNLVWLPWPPAGEQAGSEVDEQPEPQPVLAPGDKRVRSIGAQSFEFIGAFEEGLGAYESCSLFSPMNEFADQAAALATAQAVVDLLAQAPEPAAPAPAAVLTTPRTSDRRGFLFGRSSG